jgi:hypothetical protein
LWFTRRLHCPGIIFISAASQAPVALFRQLLKERHLSKDEIKAAIKSPGQSGVLSERECSELAEAVTLDGCTGADQTQIIADSAAFEEKLAAWFVARGVRVRLQDDLAQEQYAMHGRPVATPDLLFLDKVTINSQPCAWIDAKNFYGCSSVPRMPRKIAEQTQRYVDHFGPGAVVFSHGHSSELHAPQVFMLGPPPSSVADVILVDRVAP